jgi:hypothetical protein
MGNERAYTGLGPQVRLPEGMQEVYDSVTSEWKLVHIEDAWEYTSEAMRNVSHAQFGMEDQNG